MTLGNLKFNFEISAPERFGTVVRDQQSIDEAIQKILSLFEDKTGLVSEVKNLAIKAADSIYSNDEDKEIKKTCLIEFFNLLTRVDWDSNGIILEFNNTNFYMFFNKTSFLLPKEIQGENVVLYDMSGDKVGTVSYKTYGLTLNKIEEIDKALYFYPEFDLKEIIEYIETNFSEVAEKYSTTQKQENNFNFNTTGDGLLVLHVNKEHNKEKTDIIGNTTAEYLNNLADLAEEAKKANTPNDQILKDAQKKLEEQTDNKIKDFLNRAGLSENPTDEEIQEVTEEAANKLADALQNGALNNDSKTGNELADTLLDGLRDNSMNGSGGNDNNSGKGRNPIGLRYDIYNAMTLIGKIPDPTMVLFPAAISTVIANYFMTGTLIITVHLGGTAIVGVGTKLLSLALPGLSKAIITLGNNVPGMPGYQSGLCSNSYPNLAEQGKAWSNAISGDLYQTGSTITELVIGTMVGSPSPIPFVGTGMKQQLTTTVLKVLVLVASMASYIVMQAAGMAACITGKQETLENIIGIPKMFKDLNDFFAALMSVAVKAGLLLTPTKTLCTTTASTGTGLIVPIGP